MRKLLGLALLIAGIYFLGQNVIFTSWGSRYFWRNLPAAGAVLCLVSGCLALIFARRETGGFGWVLVGSGIVLVFLSGGVFLKPTSLWQFLVGFTALAGGYKLMTTRRNIF